VALISFFVPSACFTIATIAVIEIAALCKDVHILVNIIIIIVTVAHEVVQQFVHLEVKLEIVTVGAIAPTVLSLVIAVEEEQLVPTMVLLLLDFEELADEEAAARLSSDAAALITLNLFASEWLLIVVLIRGSDQVGLKVGTLGWICGLPHVHLAGHGQAARLHLWKVTVVSEAAHCASGLF